MTKPAELSPIAPMHEPPTRRSALSVRSPQWHYTSLNRLASILKEGRIRASPWRRDGRLIVRAAWTSSAAIWEPTATATSAITVRREFAVEDLLCGDMPPVARIGVATDGLLDWTEYLLRIGVADAHIWHLAECGYECGANPENWAVNPGPIPSSAWLRVEVWASAWVPIEICTDPELRQLAALAPASSIFGPALLDPANPRPSDAKAHNVQPTLFRRHR